MIRSQALPKVEGGPYLTGSKPIALAVLRYMTPNAVGLLPLSGRTLLVTQVVLLPRTIGAGLKVLDRHLLHRVGQLKAEDLGIEVEFSVKGALGGLGAAEAVLLPLEGEVGHGQSLGAHGLEHHLRLIGWNDFVLKSLEEDHGACAPFTQSSTLSS